MGALSAFSWARSIVVDQNLGEPWEVALSDGGFEVAGTHVPVTVTPNPHPHPILREVHACEVAGRRFEAESFERLREKVAAQLERIAPGGHLPVGWVRAPAADYELPIYQVDEQLVCPMLGGRTLRSRSIGGIRHAVARRFVAFGYVNDVDDVEILLQRDDLKRAAPAAVLRSLSDPGVWKPCVGAGDSLEPYGGGQTTDIVTLVRSEDDAFAESVRPSVWAAASLHTQDAHLKLVARLTDEAATQLSLPVLSTAGGYVTTALEDDGITVFAAADSVALAHAVGTRLAAGGFLREAGDVSLVAA